MQPDLLLYIIGVVLEFFDLVSKFRSSFPVATNGGGEKSVQLLSTLVSNVDVFLERLNRRRAEDICQYIGHPTHTP